MIYNANMKQYWKEDFAGKTGISDHSRSDMKVAHYSLSWKSTRNQTLLTQVIIFFFLSRTRIVRSSPTMGQLLMNGMKFVRRRRIETTKDPKEMQREKCKNKGMKNDKESSTRSQKSNHYEKRCENTKSSIVSKWEVSESDDGA